MNEQGPDQQRPVHKINPIGLALCAYAHHRDWLTSNDDEVTCESCKAKLAAKAQA